MTKQEKKILDTQTDVVTASKMLVSNSRTWAQSMREAMLAPLTGASEDNQMMTMMVEPWVSMTRLTHERFLDAYETQANEMIERSSMVMDQFKSFQQFQK
jgi:hypothetical protein